MPCLPCVCVHTPLYLYVYIIYDKACAFTKYAFNHINHINHINHFNHISVKSPDFTNPGISFTFRAEKKAGRRRRFPVFCCDMLFTSALR